MKATNRSVSLSLCLYMCVDQYEVQPGYLGSHGQREMKDSGQQKEDCLSVLFIEFCLKTTEYKFKFNL